MSLSQVTVIYVIVGMVLLLARQHQSARAVEFYVLGSTFPCVANFRWFADAVEQPIDVTVAELPADVIAATKERGCARDLWTTASELLEMLEQVSLSDELSYLLGGFR